MLAGSGSLLGMIIGRDEEHPELGVAIPREDIEALLSAYGITLPRRDPEATAPDFLGAISMLIQCTASSSIPSRIAVRPASAAGDPHH